MDGRLMVEFPILGAIVYRIHITLPETNGWNPKKGGLVKHTRMSMEVIDPRSLVSWFTISLGDVNHLITYIKLK